MQTEVTNILIVALILLLLGASGGIVMAMRVFRNKGLEIPPVLPAAHGLLGLSGIVIIGAVLLTYGMQFDQALSLALASLLVAVVFGLYLVSFHLRKKPHPKAVVPVHALFAVIGVALLLWTIIQLTQ